MLQKEEGTTPTKIHELQSCRAELIMSISRDRAELKRLTRAEHQAIMAFAL